MSKRGLVLWPYALAVALTACAFEAQEQSDQVAVTRAPLWLNPGSSFWPNGNIPVCFEPNWPGAESTPEYATQAARIQQVLEAHYETIQGASINLTGFQRCASRPLGSLPGQVRVVISPASTTCSNWVTRYCEPGTTTPYPGTDCSAGRDVTAVETLVFVCGRSYGGVGTTKWDDVLLHEFMHVLAGAGHELDRYDNWTDCAGNGKGTIDKPQLTDYDPISVTNVTYCRFDSLPLTLSPLDRLAVEMIYPATLFTPTRATYAFNYHGGLVVRSNSTITTDWTYRGGAPDAYSATANFVWRLNGSTFGPNAPSLPASSLTAGTTTQVEDGFTDFRDRSHYYSAQVRLDHKRFSAIAMNVLQ